MAEPIDLDDLTVAMYEAYCDCITEPSTPFYELTAEQRAGWEKAAREAYLLILQSIVYHKPSVPIYVPIQDPFMVRQRY